MFINVSLSQTIGYQTLNNNLKTTNKSSVITKQIKVVNINFLTLRILFIAYLKLLILKLFSLIA